LVTTALILVLTGLFLYGCQTTSPAPGSISANQQAGIWVSGEGKVSVAPDVTNLSLGIEAQASTVAEAQNQANEAMNKVMNALTANGIDSKDIQTRYFNIQKVTRWDQDQQQEITVGYRVTNLVNTKIRDVAKAGVIIDEVTKAGGDLTRVDSISFTIDNPTPYYDKAREKAMADAKDKAKRLAELAGVKLGKATYIAESGGQVNPPVPMPVMKVAAEESAVTPISTGELEIILNIQVVYAIR